MADSPDARPGYSIPPDLIFIKKGSINGSLVNGSGREGIRTPDPLGVNQVL